jgi:hypothetical protein
MANTERLSPGALLGLIAQLEQRVAKPEEVREFLAEFVACVAAGEQVPSETLRCLQKLFAGYLAGSHKTLDAAFLTVRGQRGNPGADEGRELGIAVTILDARVRNPALSHEDAVETACEQYACGSTKAGKAWSRKRKEALEALRLIRALFNDGLTADEITRAQEIACPEGDPAD